MIQTVFHNMYDFEGGWIWQVKKTAEKRRDNRSESGNNRQEENGIPMGDGELF